MMILRCIVIRAYCLFFFRFFVFTLPSPTTLITSIAHRQHTLSYRRGLPFGKHHFFDFAGVVVVLEWWWWRRRRYYFMVVVVAVPATEETLVQSGGGGGGGGEGDDPAKEIRVHSGPSKC
jgi:hypothetical protein